MLAVNRSVGVTPEVNLRNSLYTGDNALKSGIHLALKHRTEVQNRAPAVPQKGLLFFPNFHKERPKNKLDWSKQQTGLDIKLLWWELPAGRYLPIFLMSTSWLLKPGCRDKWWTLCARLRQTRTVMDTGGIATIKTTFVFVFRFVERFLQPAYIYVFWGKVIISIVSVSLSVWMGSQVTTNHNATGQSHGSVQTCYLGDPLHT